MGLNLALVEQATTTSGGIMSLLPPLVMFGALMYFMVIRPQKKRQEKTKNLMGSLQVGDTIQTIGGFIGDIDEVDVDEFVIISEGTKLRIKKNAVAIKLNENANVSEIELKKVEPEVNDNDEEDFQVEDFEI